MKKIRDAHGGAFESRGKFFMRITIAPQDRPAKLLPWCTSLADAQARAHEVQALVNRLRLAGQDTFVSNLVKAAAEADTEMMSALAKGVDGITAGILVKAPAAAKGAKADTFATVAEEWTSGRLHSRFPDHVNKKRTADDDVGRLEKWVYPVVRDLPIRQFTRAHAQEVMRRIPATSSRATRRQIAQLMVRVLNLAVYPLELIPVSPLPRGFLPKVGKRIAFGYLYPAEDRTLLRFAAIELPQRLFYGFLAREGMRCEEALSLTWADVDLERGTVRLDENKTEDPRMWPLGADVVRALVAWKKLCADAGETDKVFVGLVRPHHLADAFRRHLGAAGVVRPELFERTDARRPIRVHDLRATFVTLSLANGKSETWVSDRTGHKSSVMLARYRRAARSAGELGLGWLAPLDAAIPEFAATNAAANAAADPNEGGERSEANAIEVCGTAEEVHGRGLEPLCLAAAEPKLSSSRPVTDGRGLGDGVADSRDPSPSSLPRPAATSVEDALARALDAATSAGRFDVVAQIAEELRARRLARDGVHVLPTAKKRRGPREP